MMVLTLFCPIHQLVLLSRNDRENGFQSQWRSVVASDVFQLHSFTERQIVLLCSPVSEHETMYVDDFS
jgi:hypothetical protein